MGLQRNDILFAHMALHLVPELSLRARRVGAAIIEHYNKRTGQCDPSVERIARMLGIDRATVLRATAELCKDEDGLFSRVTHGGRSHRTAYLPRWDRLNAIVDDWDLRMKDGKAPSKVAELRRSRSQNCDIDSRSSATQTDRRNRQKEPNAVSLSKATNEKTSSPSKPKRRNGQGNQGAEPIGQRFLVHPIPGGRDTSKTAATEAAAERKRMAEINALPDVESRERGWLVAMGEASR